MITPQERILQTIDILRRFCNKLPQQAKERALLEDKIALLKNTLK